MEKAGEPNITSDMLYQAHQCTIGLKFLSKVRFSNHFSYKLSTHSYPMAKRNITTKNGKGPIILFLEKNYVNYNCMLDEV